MKDQFSSEKSTTTCTRLDPTSGPRSFQKCPSVLSHHQSSDVSFTSVLASTTMPETSSSSCSVWFLSTTHQVATPSLSALRSVTNNLPLHSPQCWLFPSCFSPVSSLLQVQFQSSWRNSSTCQSSSMDIKLLCKTNSNQTTLHSTGASIVRTLQTKDQTLHPSTASTVIPSPRLQTRASVAPLDVSLLSTPLATCSHGGSFNASVKPMNDQ